MSLTLMYITNNPQVAAIAQKAGVDRIWVDMEYIGKEDRQKGMNTVKSFHTVEDVRALRSIVTCSQLMVRVNPWHCATDEYGSSEEEIDAVIDAGADVIMLPYFKTKAEVTNFIRCVNGRATAMILVETAEAVSSIDEILSVPGIDEVHIGLNDLHLAYGMKFMFELLADGTVEKLCKKIAAKGLKYGFGGIARVGYGMLPAEYIMGEHYRLGSTRAILSRGFCDANIVADPSTIENIFIEGVENIRKKEKELEHLSLEQFAENRWIVAQKVREIVKSKESLG
ncbi:MAG: aldolase [Ruminococcaceae bacterium]|nr:aldolase [Oscillospiraceae bacterium]